MARRKNGSITPDDPALIDRFPEYNPETDIGDRPPTPTREISSRQRPSKKKKYLSATKVKPS